MMNTVKRLAGGVLPLTAISAALVLVSAAHAASPSYSGGSWLLENYHSRKCLDVYGWSTASGARVDQWTCYPRDTNQQWKFAVWGEASDPNPTVQLINAHSGKCLDDTLPGRTNGTRMQQWRCLYRANGQPRPNQLWVFVARPVKGGHDYEIVNKLSGRALEINGNESSPSDHTNLRQGDIVDQWRYWGGQNQIWYTIPTA